MQHIIFFITMYTIDLDVEVNLKDSDDVSLMRLNHAAVSQEDAAEEDGMSIQEVKEYELIMFKILQYGHLFCFTFQLASFYLKKKGYYNIA